MLLAAVKKADDARLNLQSDESRRSLKTHDGPLRPRCSRPLSAKCCGSDERQLSGMQLVEIHLGRMAAKGRKR